MPICAIGEGSGESAHLRRLTLAFVTVQNLLCCLKWQFVCYSRQKLILWWVCIFAQAKSLDNVISIKISCAGSECSWESARLHRHSWAFVTVSKYHVLAEMAIFCNAYVNSECCGESAPATTALLCNHQCVVSMRQKCFQCVVIKFLNKTFASLPKKKYKVVIVFWMLFHGNMTTAALRHADFPQLRQLH